VALVPAAWAALVPAAWAALVIVAAAPLSARADSGAFVESSRIGDATHFEFRGLASWRYELRRENGGNAAIVVLRAPKISPESAGKLRAHSDALIESIAVAENGLDEQAEIAFRLRGKDVDSFDYISEQPSRLIIDFFPKEDRAKAASEDGDEAEGAPASASELKAIAAKKSSRSEKKAAQNLEKKPGGLPSQLPQKKAAAQPKASPSASAARQPAATEFIHGSSEGGGEDASPANSPGAAAAPADGKDRALYLAGKFGLFDSTDPTYNRFMVQDYEIREESAIASRANIYIRFPMLKIEHPSFKAMLEKPVKYEIVPQDTDENREARLVLTLRANHRPAVFLRAAADFLKRFPESRYEEIVRYMVADQHLEFWQKEPARAEELDTAIAMYQTLATRHPDSPATPRTEILIGNSFLSRGDSLAALAAFQKIVEKNAAVPALADGARISEAEAYLSLNRFEEALAALDKVEKSAAQEIDRAEAAYRKGDVAFQQKDFNEAIRLYQRAIKAFPAHERDFPNAAFNQAEASFWQPKYKEAMRGYREFLVRHPSHPYGGFALERLGDLMEILGAGQRRAAGAWMESGFRYRGSPGADVARTRLLTTRMPEMQEKELGEAMREIDRIAGRSKLPHFLAFASLVKADGLFGRGDYEKAAAELIGFYQKNPGEPDLEKFKERIVRCLSEEIRASVEKGAFIDALRQDADYKGSWLKGSDRIDTQAYVGRAYEQAGLLGDAAATYRDALNKLYSIKGTARERERGVFETLPTTDSLNLRLAATAAAEKDYPGALEYLRAIARPAALPDEQRVERAQIAADVAEARGQADAARKSLEELVGNWTGKPALVAPAYLRLGKIEAGQREWTRAAADAAKVLDLQADTGLVPEDAHAGALELKASVALARGRKAEAARAYRQLLEAYGEKRPLGSVRYKLGQLLFDMGDLKEAEGAWGGLSGRSDAVWAKLAQEQMESAKWQAEYRKYVRRIPAMAASAGAAAAASAGKSK
jgi:tetratricopeptide (TPR) repeat protein